MSTSIEPVQDGFAMRIDMRFAVLALTVGLTLVFSGICSAQPAEEGADSGPSGEVRMPVDKNVLPLDFELNTDSGKAQSDKAEGDKTQNDKTGTEASTDGKTVDKPADKKAVADKKAPAQEKKTSATEPAQKKPTPAKTVQPNLVEKAETQKPQAPKPAVADKKEEVTPAGYGAVKDVEMEQTKDGYVFLGLYGQARGKDQVHEPARPQAAGGRFDGQLEKSTARPSTALKRAP